MDKIMLLERELKLNKFHILKCKESFEKEYRNLLIQRSNLKDMLLDAYRNETLERRKDYEYVSGNQN